MRYVLFVAADGLDALEGEAVRREAPYANAMRIVCARPGALAPESADPIPDGDPAEVARALDDLPRPSLVIVVGNTPLSFWAAAWAANKAIPVMHHHAGLRSGDYGSDKMGIASDAVADLLSFMDRRDQMHTQMFSPKAERVVGWPSLEVWKRHAASQIDAGSGSSGCLAIYGRVTPDQYGWATRLLDACRHACERFVVYASREFRDTIVKVQVPLPAGFRLKSFDDPAELARDVVQCRMFVTDDERLQAISAVTGRYTVVVRPLSIRWLAGQSGFVRTVDFRDPKATQMIRLFWESIPGTPFDSDTPPPASQAMCDWLKSYF